jgi:hypothetical protein
MSKLNIITVREFKENCKFSNSLLHFSLVMEYNKSKNVGNGFIVDPSPTDLSNFYKNLDKQKEIDKENEKNERECMFKEDRYVKDMEFYIQTRNEFKFYEKSTNHINTNAIKIIHDLKV